MTQDKPLNDTPSKVVKARKKILLEQQKHAVDIDELVRIKKELEEVEYLLTRYSEPTTRRKIEKDEKL